MNHQLTLNIPANHRARFENFFWQNNTILHQALLASLSFDLHAERFFYLWGATGSGKSHLLEASCHYLGTLGYPCAYLPLETFIHTDPKILENLEQLTLVAIDDLEQIAGNPAWEETLFHCYNKVSAQEKTRLFLTASCPIANLNIQLPDLKSRLTACVNFHISPLNEEDCLHLIQERLMERGLLLSEEVAQFIIRRFPRNTAKLIEIFDKLDQAAWKEQHRLTIPFVKKILNL